jgi:glycosyltransferase involved in cell wall biosynthesis
MSDVTSNLNFTPLGLPIRVTEQSWPEGTQPLVSLCCITYNHVKFICDAIEGFLIQETTFPVEILIHDDASTDGTTEIVRDYEYKYPQLIKAIYQKENQYSKGNKASLFVRPMQRGKYIALCEGDDYWTDKQKIEIQVSYLENNPTCVVSGHDVVSYDVESGLVGSSILSEYQKRSFEGEYLTYGYVWVPTQCRLYRNLLTHNLSAGYRSIKNGDDFTVVQLGNFGGSMYHPDISPSVYRLHKGGIWNGIDNRTRLLERVNTNYWIYRYLLDQGSAMSQKIWLRRWQFSVLRLVSPHQIIFFYLSELIQFMKRLYSFPTLKVDTLAYRVLFKLRTFLRW